MEKTDVWKRLDYGPWPDSDQTAIDYIFQNVKTDGSQLEITVEIYVDTKNLMFLKLTYLKKNLDGSG